MIDTELYLIGAYYYFSSPRRPFLARSRSAHVTAPHVAAQIPLATVFTTAFDDARHDARLRDFAVGMRRRRLPAGRAFIGHGTTTPVAYHAAAESRAGGWYRHQAAPMARRRPMTTKWSKSCRSRCHPSRGRELYRHFDFASSAFHRTVNADYGRRRNAVKAFSPATRV